MSRPKRFLKIRSGAQRFASFASQKMRERRLRTAQSRNEGSLAFTRDTSSGLHTYNGAKRVVITGMGAITVLGLNVKDTWANLQIGKSGIGPITQFDASNLPVRIAGEVHGFDATKYIEPKESRRMARVSHFAVAAAQEALQDSGLRIGIDVANERVGVVMGTALGGFEMSDAGMVDLRAMGYRRMNPFALPAALPTAPGHHISRTYGAKGPLDTVVAACASGTQAIGNAADLIRRGKTDVMFAGGVEAVINDGAIASFALMRVLCTTHNDDPTHAQRPFDATRNGFAHSEGCVVLILESLEHAQARGAKIYGEVLGLGVSSDAHHIAIPDPTGSGAIRAMKWALEDAGIHPDQVDYINAHGSATQTNDPLETKAIKEVFGERAYNIPVTSTKSMTGHAMGAAGAIEAMTTVLSLKYSVLTPTINLTVPDPECDLDYVPNVARAAELAIGLSNSFGLGGQNACLALGKYD